MKLFEVITEHCPEDSKEIVQTVTYTTAEDNSIMTVTRHFTNHCMEYEKDLISVRELCSITVHISRQEKENGHD